MEASRSTRRIIQSRILLAALSSFLFLGLGAGGFVFLASLRQPPPRQDALPPQLIVEVQPVRRQDYVERISGYGRAEALRASDVAAEISGVIIWISPKLEAGSLVEEGEELVRLDDRDYRQAEATAEARVAQASAALQRAEAVLEGLRTRLAVARAELETARRQLRRTEAAVERGAANISDLDTQRLLVSARERSVVELEAQERAALPERNQWEAELQAAEAQLATARHNLARTVIRAPYRGHVVARYAQLGAQATPGTRLFRLVDRSLVEVAIALPASRYGQIRTGARVEVRLREEEPVVWSGPLERIAPAIDPESRTFRVYVVISDPTGVPVPPGALVVARVQGRTFRGVFVVPRVAFLGDRVFVVRPDRSNPSEGVVEERRPMAEEFLPDVVLVRSGLEEGQEVVVTNVDQVAQGTHVRIYRHPQHAYRPFSSPAAWLVRWHRENGP